MITITLLLSLWAAIAAYRSYPETVLHISNYTHESYPADYIITAEALENMERGTPVVYDGDGRVSPVTNGHYPDPRYRPSQEELLG